MPTPPEAAVVVAAVTRRFGPVRACAEMTWSAPAGAVTAILGPNGAGKTTVIDCAVGLARPDEGQVRVLGVDPWHSPAEHRARVGVMLQTGGLPNGAPPLVLLRHLRALYADPAPLAPLIERLGIAEFGRTPVRRLSGGQKQRLALAAALLGRPEVAFLDEPTAGLDPHGRLDVWDLLTATRAAGTTVVVTTHSFDEAERLADHLVIVGHGRTLVEGSVPDVTRGSTLEAVYFDVTRAGPA